MSLSAANNRRFLAIVVALGMLVLTSHPAAAQGDGETIAEGLNGPMGVLVDPDGNVWVVDSGLGGDDSIDVINPDTGESEPASLGNSARLVKVDAAGTMTDVANFASVATAQEASGPARIALLDGKVYVTVLGWDGSAGTAAPDGFATIMSVDADGTTTEVAAFWPWEEENNVYPPVLDTHPYGIIAGPEGQLLVADAAANALVSVDPATGAITTVAVFDPIPGVFPRPDLGGEMLTDPVPTAVTIGPDGTMYVSLLSGAPFVPGSAKVMAVAADGTVTDYATNLTMLTDLRTGPDGNMYATQFAVFGEQGPTPNSGAVVRIGAGETSEVVLADLSFPTSLDFDADGNAYVTINGVGAPGSGQVVKYAGLAAPGGSTDEPAATPVPAPTELPTTGGETWLVSIVGAAIVGAGLLVLRSRREITPSG